VSRAIDIMHQHGFGQLPVIDGLGNFQVAVVTFESILRAVQAFGVPIVSLAVHDVAQNLRTYPRDADLLATLDDIHRENFALIVEGTKLVGIVTTADVATYFRGYAEDLMQIEGIEARLKDAIRALYFGDDIGLDSAIAAVTDRGAEIRKRLPNVIKAYLEKANFAAPSENLDPNALVDAEKRLGLPTAAKSFEDLALDEFINVLFRHPRAPKLSSAKDVSELRGLLQKVRDVRNKLAHFRGELTAEERRIVQFAAEWLERNVPVAPAEAPGILVHVPEDMEREESDSTPRGSYAQLALHLQSQPTVIITVTLTFQDIEDILSAKLPPSAYEHRAWWSNDPTKPQSAAWLEEGWRTTSVNMTERRLSFVRTDVREQAYIKFFAKLNARIARETDFPLRNTSPQGQSWHNLASLDESRPDLAMIAASFARGKRLRIELYLDVGEKEATKKLFDRLKARQTGIERMVGEPLEWERLDERRACRVAVYTKAQVLADAESPTLLEWAAQRATTFYRVFEPELVALNMATIER
jgi:CBS domain-containing protein